MYFDCLVFIFVFTNKTSNKVDLYTSDISADSCYTLLLIRNCSLANISSIEYIATKSDINCNCIIE